MYCQRYDNRNQRLKDRKVSQKRLLTKSKIQEFHIETSQTVLIPVLFHKFRKIWRIKSTHLKNLQQIHYFSKISVFYHKVASWEIKNI